MMTIDTTSTSAGLLRRNSTAPSEASGAGYALVVAPPRAAGSHPCSRHFSGFQWPRVGFARYWTRASFTRSWRALLAVALLLGLIGGLSLFAIAGARRTQSAYPRFLRSTNPSTMVVDVGGLNAEGYAALDAIAHLPEVAQARSYVAFYVAPWVDDHVDLSANFEAIGSLDGRYFDQDRFTPIHGRVPDPTRADEVAVNEESARRYGYHVGQKIDFATVSATDVESAQSPDELNGLRPRLLTHATIVGIGAFIEEVSPGRHRPIATRAVHSRLRQSGEGPRNLRVAGPRAPQRRRRRRRGQTDHHRTARTAAPTVLPRRPRPTPSMRCRRAVRCRSPSGSSGSSPGSQVSPWSARRWAGTSVVTARNARSPEHSAPNPTQITGASVAGPAVAVVVGTLFAVGVALLASPLMPIGSVRRVEVASGFDADWAVLGSGVAVAVIGLFAWIGVVAWREAPHRVLARREVGLENGSRPGARFGEASADGGGRIPFRRCAGQRLERRVITLGHGQRGRRPDRTHGRRDFRRGHAAPRCQSPFVRLELGCRARWTAPGTATPNPTKTEAVLSANHDVEGWSGAFFGAEDVNGSNIPLLGMEPSSSVTPPILSGRMVERAGEIVLGTATLRQLDVAIGDTVQTTSGPARVVGSATFPTIGIVHGDHTSLGVGGIVVTEQVPGYDRNIAGPESDPTSVVRTPADAYGPNVLFVRFRAGTDIKAAVGRLAPTATRSPTTTASRSRRSSAPPRSSTPTTSATRRPFSGASSPSRRWHPSGSP